jgi:hypothetical protein
MIKQFSYLLVVTFAFLMLWNIARADPTVAASIVENSSLDTALNIVIENSEALSGKRELINITERKSTYSAKVRVGANYGQKQTLQTASGLDMQAGVGVEIPLFDDGGKSRDVAQAKIDFINERDKLIAAFLTDVNSLMMLERTSRTLLDDVTLAREKLAYFKEGQKKAIIDAASLWSVVEPLKKAEQAVYLSDEKYKITLLLTSKQYAPHQYIELQAAINQYIVNESATKTTISSCQSSVGGSAGVLGSCPAAAQ